MLPKEPPGYRRKRLDADGQNIKKKRKAKLQPDNENVIASSIVAGTLSGTSPAARAILYLVGLQGLPISFRVKAVFSQQPKRPHALWLSITSLTSPAISCLSLVPAALDWCPPT